MEGKLKTRVTRDDWVTAALDTIHAQGVDRVKVVTLARTLGVTSGSFYWHFKNVRALLDAVLEYWENQLTVHIIDDAIAFQGSPQQRILNLMTQVVDEDATLSDSAIAVWAKSDPLAEAAYKRTVQKRFDFAAHMFREAGFSGGEAMTRGRMMVTALMGERSVELKSDPTWKSAIKDQWAVLIAGSNGGT